VALCLLVGKLLGWSRANTDALVLSVAFMNAGNFGLSVALFTFGDVGLEMATAFFVFSSFAGNTIAGFFAARGNHGSKAALRKALALPAPWTFLIALSVRVFELPVPDVLFSPLQLIGRAQMPIMLMLLGIQLSQTRIGHRYKDVAVGVVMRLVVGSLVALGLAPLVGLEGLARQVAVMQGSTPSAVTSALMAIEFDADAEYVTSVIFITTLLSSVTLTIVIGLLI
jgi:malate permease and related proteins